MRRTALIVIFLGVVATGGAARANDWVFAPSYYTHNPQSGERVTQYSPVGPFYVHSRPDYQQSGYRHKRSSLRNSDGSFDNIHIIEEWGRPVRPYGEWQHPYRPDSVPYNQWGPSYVPWGPFFGNSPWITPPAPAAPRPSGYWSSRRP